jgi:curli production assembly/transport component CsgG
MITTLQPWCGHAAAGLIALSLAACVGMPINGPAGTGKQAQLTPTSASFRDLVNLPPPKGKIVAAVYGFRDQTGQYKPAPDSSFSTAVTQGASSILVKSLKDSQWFIPVERENLQNLLTERRVIRAADSKKDASDLSPLLPSSIILEGGIVGFETNVKSGGAGARYLGVGASTLYQTDQVTVNLRAVDIRSGRVLNSVSTTKAIYSYQVDLNLFKYVSYQSLLELEVGFARNEPAQLCITEAIEAAVIHLIVQGVMESTWALKDQEDLNSPIFRKYVSEQRSVINSYVKTHEKLPGNPDKAETMPQPQNR